MTFTGDKFQNLMSLLVYRGSYISAILYNILNELGEKR